MDLKISNKDVLESNLLLVEIYFKQIYDLVI